MEEGKLTIREVVERVKRFFMRRQQAYRHAFLGKNGELVLKDLARFCRAHKSTFHADPRIHAVLEGRREVWLRIEEHLNLTSEQFWQLHGKDLE